MSSVSKIIISLVVLAGVVIGALAWHDRQSSSPVKPSGSLQSASTSPSPSSYAVKVYFSKHPQSDADPTATFAVARTSPDSGVGKFAISQLLVGPTGAEANAGLFTPGLPMSGTSTCGGSDFTLKIAGQTATLQFCRATSLKGVVADGQLNAEMTATLKQFPSVTKVTILNQSGHCLFDASGQDLCKQ